jgi:flagellar biosynthetic protein FliR
VNDLFTPQTVLAFFAIFCRVGACLLIAPGFSSAQIPARIRLYVALASSLALAPMLIDLVKPKIGDGSGVALFTLFFVETAAGFLIGFIARVFFMALQFITVAMTQAIGLSAMPGTVMDDEDQSPALSTLYSIGVTTLLFVAGLHIQVLRALLDSYVTIPPGQPFNPQPALIDIADQAGSAFLIALRVGSPFIVYSVVVNFAIGVTNKLTPQIPVFFIATPFVMLGGLFLLLLTVHDFFGHFLGAFSAWLNGG